MSIIGKIKKTLAEQEPKTPKKEAAVTRAKKENIAGASVVREVVFSLPVHAAQVIENPYITEKTSALAAHNTYVFRVARRATKNEIVKAIQRMFKVTVMKVNVMNMPGKKVRVGGRAGRVPGFKKAMVTIKDGEKIDIGV